MTSQTTEAVLGRSLGGEAVRIGLENEIAVMAALDLVLVDFTLAEIGNEDLPDSRGAAIAHGMPAAVPVIEIADDADSLRIRCPDGEVHAAKALVRSNMGTEPLIIAVVRPFAEQVQVEIGEDRPEADRDRRIPTNVPRRFSTREPIGEPALPCPRTSATKKPSG